MEASPAEDDVLITIDLKKYFPIRGTSNPFRLGQEKKYVKAVDGVSIKIPRGKTIALVGESGCGKTTLARSLTLLSPPTSGDIIFDHKIITKGKVRTNDLYRRVQMVFQDPDSSLDPGIKVKDTISEPLRGLLKESKDTITNKVTQSLADVGLSQDFAERYPSQLSGGQKQRVAIARAIAPRPDVLILDEPTSALDASVQAQILNLLLQLQRNLSLTFVLITHNIAVAQYLADLIAVMYAGNVVEYGPIDTVLARPSHPYTMTLVSAAPIPNPWKRNLLNIEIKGEVPSAINPPSGCKFHPRCPYAKELCSVTSPELRSVGPKHLVSCHYAEDIVNLRTQTIVGS